MTAHERTDFGVERLKEKLALSGSEGAILGDRALRLRLQGLPPEEEGNIVVRRWVIVRERLRRSIAEKACGSVNCRSGRG